MANEIETGGELTETCCAFCGDKMPLERVLRGAITCTNEHAKLRAKLLDALRRSRKNERQCLYCHKPSTPEDRKAYLLFKRLAKKMPHLLYPAEFDAWRLKMAEDIDRTEMVDPEAFAKWWNEKEPEADDDERPTGPPAVKLPPMEAPGNPDLIYIFQRDQFGKNGQACKMLKTTSSRRDVVQVRFADGYMPVVARSALRTPKPSEINLVDEMREVERTLAASGKTHAGE